MKTYIVWTPQGTRTPVMGVLDHVKPNNRLVVRRVDTGNLQTLDPSETEWSKTVSTLDTVALVECVCSF